MGLQFKEVFMKSQFVQNRAARWDRQIEHGGSGPPGPGPILRAPFRLLQPQA